MFKKVTKILGVAGVVVGALYWFDLDDKVIAKSEPLLRKIAGVKKMSKRVAAVQGVAQTPATK